MKETFAGRIRTAARAIAPDTFTRRDLSTRAEIRTREEDRKIAFVIGDMRKSGEITNISRGVYVYMGKRKQKKQIREILWRALRATRHATIDELRELSGASEDYTREWLRMLQRQEVVAEKNGRYRLIKDSGPSGMPGDVDKAKRLRTLRKKKKAAALSALDKAESAIHDAREAIKEGLDDV